MSAYGRRLVGTLVLTRLVCPAAYSHAGEAPQEASWFTGWTFEVAPFYLWLPAQDGTVTVRGQSADVDLSVGETLDLLFEAAKFGAGVLLGEPEGGCLGLYQVEMGTIRCCSERKRGECGLL